MANESDTPFARLDDRREPLYGRWVRRRVATGLVLIPLLGIGATALAQGGEDHGLKISMHRGCLSGTRVTVRIEPPTDQILSPVHLRADGHEVVHLTGVTQTASVTMRLPNGRGRVSVSGETTGGRRFSSARDYRPCAPKPTATPRPQRIARPEPTLSGGGEG
jgi:hypothetical protein